MTSPEPPSETTPTRFGTFTGVFTPTLLRLWGDYPGSPEDGRSHRHHVLPHHHCMINVVLLIEGGLGLVSYRPTLQVPRIVPTIGLISVAMTLAVCLSIRQRGVEQGVKGDVRSGIFVAFAEWAAGKVTPEDLDSVRA